MEGLCSFSMFNWGWAKLPGFEQGSGNFKELQMVNPNLIEINGSRICQIKNVHFLANSQTVVLKIVGVGGIYCPGEHIPVWKTIFNKFYLAKGIDFKALTFTRF